MTQISAIFWAQWRTLYHFLSAPRRRLVCRGRPYLVRAMVCRRYRHAARLQQPRSTSGDPHRPARGGLLLMLFLYWQVVPLMLATTGSSLDLRKLRAYPIPDSQLFSIEVLLRVTAGVENGNWC